MAGHGADQGGGGTYPGPHLFNSPVGVGVLADGCGDLTPEPWPRGRRRRGWLDRAGALDVCAAGRGWRRKARGHHCPRPGTSPCPHRTATHGLPGGSRLHHRHRRGHRRGGPVRCKVRVDRLDRLDAAERDALREDVLAPLTAHAAEVASSAETLPSSDNVWLAEVRDGMEVTLHARFITAVYQQGSLTSTEPMRRLTWPRQTLRSPRVGVVARRKAATRDPAGERWMASGGTTRPSTAYGYLYRSQTRSASGARALEAGGGHGRGRLVRLRPDLNPRRSDL